MATAEEPQPAWMWAVRIGIPLAAVGVVVALRPEIVTGTFSSVRSALKVLALLAAWVLFSFLVRRFVANTVARTAIVALAGATVLFVTVLPYFRDKTVDEALPTASAPVTTAAPAAPPAPAGDATPATTVPAAATGPQKVTTGEFRGLAGHRGAGEAALYRQPDGSHLVRLEDFDVSSVPAPVLYLVPGANRQGIDGAVKLGGLRGNQGSQNFTVPAGTDVSGPQTILIWCEAFSVPVAGASQSPA